MPDPSPSSLDHLLAELARVDLLVRVAVHRAREVAGDDAFRGLTISEADVDALFARPLGAPPWVAAPPPPAPADLAAKLAELTVEVDRVAADLAARGARPRLATLRERFGLDRFDLDVLLLALAPEIDLRYERLFAYLNDDITRKRPTVDATLGLLCPDLSSRLAARLRFERSAPLIRHGLVRVTAEPAGAPLLARALEVDPRIVAFLHGDDALDSRIAAHARLVTPALRLDELRLPDDLRRALPRFVGEGEQEQAPIVHLHGPPGAGKRALCAALCLHAGRPLLGVDCAALLATGDEAFGRAAALVKREALLSGAAVHWEDAGAVLDGDHPLARSALLDALRELRAPCFLSGPAPWHPAGALGRRPFLGVAVPRPSAADQARLWADALGEPRASDADLETLTGAYRLTGGQIGEAAATARSLARFHDRDGARPLLTDLTEACRLRHRRRLSALARPIPRRHGWDDLVLVPDRKAMLREVCVQLRHRSRVLGAWGFDAKLGTGKGLSALFSGPPGTGKTMAAGVIAAELGVDAYQIDLSTVVSKYVGETEKRLSELFDEAEAAGAALFFDEADALFGKRTEVRDAHDRYANLETSYLLQRIDTYEGVVILASNFLRNIDEAFVRRFGFIVEFPFPGLAERLRIWKGIWPPETPRAAEVDLEFLAQRVELSGGYIRNIAVAAAFLAAEEKAAVGMKHLLHAARREFQKMGKVVDEGQLAYPGRR
jgi:AAA+ superfamily predicted ATPase